MTHEFVHINTHPEWYNKKQLDMADCLMNLKIEMDCSRKIMKEVNHINEYLERLDDEEIS